MDESPLASVRRSPLRDWVSRRPLLAFVILACAISWLAWPLGEYMDLGVVNGFGILFTIGPALAAMIVSVLRGPEPSGVPAGKRWRLFAIVGLLTLAVMAVRRLWITPEWAAIAGPVTTTTAYPTPWALVMDIVAAAWVALILSGVYAPRQGVRDMLRSLDPRCPPVRWPWWVVAVVLYPLLIALANVLSAALGLPGAAPATISPWYWLAPDVLLTYLVFLFHGGGLEEPGWRGFALPLLQRRYRPLLASLILALIWGLWHLPYFWSAGVVGMLLGMAVYLVLEIAPLAILFTALFNRTGGSLLIAVLFHISINTTEVFLPVSPVARGLRTLIAVAIALWMWRAPQTFSPRPVEPAEMTL